MIYTTQNRNMYNRTDSRYVTFYTTDKDSSTDKLTEVCVSIEIMEREWIKADSVKALGGSSFRVVQWNILSQTLGENGDFCACPEQALEWQHRKTLLEKVIPI